MKWSALLLALAGTPVAAQPRVPPPAPPAMQPLDPATLAAARRLVAASDIANNFRTLMPQILDVTIAQARSCFKSGAMPDGLATLIGAVLRRDMVAMADIFTPAVLDRLAQPYARHLSATDLDRVATMLSDPAMSRFRQQTPAIMADTMPVLLSAMSARQEQFVKELPGIIEEWMRDHPADRALLTRKTVVIQPGTVRQ